MSIDFTKPLQTCNGMKLRLLCTDAAGHYPIVCLREDDKIELSFTLNGRYYEDLEDHPNNLMNVPEQVTVDRWMNVYPESAFVYNTKELAIGARDKGSVTLHIKRTVPVGHVDE